MDFSIIVVTYDSSPFIEACLHSVVEAAKGLDHEILVVDNASKDETCQIIERAFPQVLLIRQEVNLGFAKANNHGLQRAKGEFVLLINPDTLWKRGEAGEAVRFLRNHPEIGAMGCRLILEDGSWQRSHGNFPTLLRELKETFYLPRIFSRSNWAKGVFVYKDHPEPKPVEWVSCTFLICSRRLMAEVGYLDEEYFMYYEDIDLSKRIREQGKEVYYFPGIEIVHYQRWPSIIDFGESPYLYFKKHFGLYFTEILRYILIFKTFLRLMIFLPLTLIPGRTIFCRKFKSYYCTFKFHLFEAPRIIRSSSIGPESRPRKNSHS
jgi:GT2 family glycosyltransferase